jgi:hypothetical protein
MKFTPASRAEATMRPASAASVRSPNIIVPRQMGETIRPLLPSLRYSMGHLRHRLYQVQTGADAREVERHLGRLVGRVVVLVVGASGTTIEGRPSRRVKTKSGVVPPSEGTTSTFLPNPFSTAAFTFAHHRMVERRARGGRALEALHLDAV